MASALFFNYDCIYIDGFIHSNPWFAHLKLKINRFMAGNQKKTKPFLAPSKNQYFCV